MSARNSSVGGDLKVAYRQNKQILACGGFGVLGRRAAYTADAQTDTAEIIITDYCKLRGGTIIVGDTGTPDAATTEMSVELSALAVSGSTETEIFSTLPKVDVVGSGVTADSSASSDDGVTGTTQGVVKTDGTEVFTDYGIIACTLTYTEAGTVPTTDMDSVFAILYFD